MCRDVAKEMLHHEFLQITLFNSKIQKNDSKTLKNHEHAHEIRKIFLYE